MSILANADQRLVAGKPAHFAVFHHGAHVIRRGNHFDDAFVIAEQRSIVFIKHRRDQDDYQQRTQHSGDTRQEGIPPFSGANARQG